MPCESKSDRTLLLPLSTGPSLISAWIISHIPDLGNAAFIAGYIIDLQSSIDNAHAANGDFNLADILECKAYQDSFLEELPVLTFTPHSTAANFSS